MLIRRILVDVALHARGGVGEALSTSSRATSSFRPRIAVVPQQEPVDHEAWARQFTARVAAARPQIDRLIAALLTDRYPEVGKVLALAGVPFTLTGVCAVLNALDRAPIAPTFHATLTEIVFRSVAVAGGYVP